MRLHGNRPGLLSVPSPFPFRLCQSVGSHSPCGRYPPKRFSVVPGNDVSGRERVGKTELEAKASGPSGLGSGGQYREGEEAAFENASDLEGGCSYKPDFWTLHQMPGAKPLTNPGAHRKMPRSWAKDARLSERRLRPPERHFGTTPRSDGRGHLCFYELPAMGRLSPGH
ncbi:hypothetical protein AAFF_G00229530 [Aldrovandia affinis]|uniref:Uncharacterized protein n=1 Tax=Aldrovandia affinis TaxID=143900 RepID=A0AAD7SWQ8_9TELE|nr:hypothetical protein AAFF_G00229530 [Aldrovandia affinis]